MLYWVLKCNIKRFEGDLVFFSCIQKTSTKKLQNPCKGYGGLHFAFLQAFESFTIPVLPPVALFRHSFLLSAADFCSLLFRRQFRHGEANQGRKDRRDQGRKGKDQRGKDQGGRRQKRKNFVRLQTL